MHYTEGIFGATMMKYFNVTKFVLSSVLLLVLACNKESSDIGTVLENYDLSADQSSLPQSPQTTAPKAQTLEEAIRTDDRSAIVYFLKQEKADPNQKTEQGEPLLHLAARRGFAFAVEQLLTAGANVNAIDDYGGTALMEVYQEDYSIAAHGFDYGKVEDLLLKAGANINIADKSGLTVLMKASYVGDVESVKKLLAAGTDVNATDKEGDSALVWACVGMDSEGDYDDENKSKVVQLLLAAGADQKNQALLAASERFPLVVKTLLNAGADVNFIDEQGETPLIRASSPMGNADIVEILKSYGAKK